MNTEIIIPNTEIKLKRARLYVIGGILLSTSTTFNRNLELSIAFTSKKYWYSDSYVESINIDILILCFMLVLIWLKIPTFLTPYFESILVKDAP